MISDYLCFAIAYGLGTTIYAYRDQINLSFWMIPAFPFLCWLIRDFHVVEITMNLMLGAFMM